MKRENRAVRAFTIIEVIVIVVILGVIAAVVAPRLFQHVSASKRTVALSNANDLAAAVSRYALDCDMPEPGASLMILWERPSNVEDGKWHGPYINNPDQLKDPWGHDYVLRVPGTFNADFDVISYGKDGAEGGDGENEDIVNGKR
jgi:general secretion pathway protein G